MLVREATVRDAAAIAHVKVASWRPAYEGIARNPDLLILDPQEQVEHFTRLLTSPPESTFLLVACDADDQIVGYVRGGPEKNGDPEFTGEIYAIYLLPSHQRQGIGRLLFCQAVKELQKRNYSSLLVNTLQGSASCHFYEALGGQQLRTCSYATEELVYYGWSDLHAFRDVRSMANIESANT